MATKVSASPELNQRVYIYIYCSFRLAELSLQLDNVRL